MLHTCHFTYLHTTHTLHTLPPHLPTHLPTCQDAHHHLHPHAPHFTLHTPAHYPTHYLPPPPPHYRCLHFPAPHPTPPTRHPSPPPHTPWVLLERWGCIFLPGCYGMDLVYWFLLPPWSDWTWLTTAFGTGDMDDRWQRHCYATPGSNRHSLTFPTGRL